MVLQNQCRFLAEQSGATVISIDYRLAPEAPFPAAFDDCKDVVKWLVHHADHWNIDPNNLSIAGESAGGALAVSCGLSEVGKYLKLVIPIYGALDVCSASDLDYWDYDLYDVIPEHKKYVITRLNRFRNLMVHYKTYILMIFQMQKILWHLLCMPQIYQTFLMY